MPFSGPSLIKPSDLVSPLLKDEDVHAQIHLLKTVIAGLVILVEPMKKIRANFNMD